MSSSVSYEYLNSFIPSNCGMGYTEDGGQYITLINNTGGTTVKGTVVIASLSITNGCTTAPAGSQSPIGVIYESGIVNGQPVKVVISGKAKVLLENNNQCYQGHWAGCSDTVAGRIMSASNAPTTTAHWQEVGHILETVSAGINKLTTILLHFN